MEKYRLWMVDEIKKSNPDLTTLNRYMALTFAARRKEVGALVLTSTMKDRWPALFTSSQVCMVVWQLDSCIEKNPIVSEPCHLSK